MLVGYSAPTGLAGALANGSADDVEAALRGLGCEKIFLEDSSRHQERVALKAAIGFLRSGDVLVVRELAEIGADVESTVLLVERLRRSGVALRVGEATIVPGTPVGDAFQLACRELARLIEAPLEADGHGSSRRRGRPQALSAKDIAKARRLLAESTMTVSDVARTLGVSPATVYRYFPRRAPRPTASSDTAS